MNKCKRIAVIGAKGLPAQAGVDVVVESIVALVNKDTYQPIVYVDSKVVPKGTKVPDIEMVRIPTLPGKFISATTLFLLSALHCVFFAKYDLIHLHNVEAGFVLPLLRLRYKVLSTSHGATHERPKWGFLPKLLFKFSEIPFIYLSNSITCVAEPLTELYKNLYKRKVHFIGNGIRDETIDIKGAEKVLKECNIAPGDYILFSAGRIIKNKGTHFLLEAFRSMKTGLKLLVVGDARHDPEYEKELHDLADERVHFIHYLPLKETVFGLARSARLFVFPSTHEGMSMMLLQILSLNVPIISSDIPENDKVVAEKELLFESENVEHLRSKMEWALREPEKVAELTQNAHDYVIKNYHWNEIVKHYEALFAELSPSK